jgi:hypothetical protein
MSSYLFGVLTGFVSAALLVFGIGFLNDPQWVAAVIALAALFLGILDRKAQRDYHIASWRPHVSLDVQQRSKDVTLALRNDGPGVAHLKEATLTFDGRTVPLTDPSWPETLAARRPDLTPKFSARYVAAPAGSHLAPHREMVLLRIEGGEQILADVTLAIVVESLAGEKLPKVDWTLGAPPPPADVQVANRPG